MVRLNPTDILIKDLLTGKATYVSYKKGSRVVKGVLKANALAISKDKIVFMFGKKPLVEVEFPSTVDFGLGYTVTLEMPSVSIEFEAR